MKLVLTRNVESLGTIGEIVDVADGYGRNYLLPQGIAVPVTPQNLARLEKARQEYLEREARRLEELKELAERLEKVSLTIPMRAEGQKLYGSVTAPIIVAAFAAQGFQLEPKQILIESPIKMLGDHEVFVKLHAEIRVPIRVWVVEASEEAGIEAMDVHDEAASSVPETEQA